MNTILERLSPWLFTIGLFVLWEAACRIFKIDKFILPAPSEAFLAMGQYWRPLLRHSAVTLWTTMAGFALAVAFGIVLGLIVGWSRAIYRGLYPVMIGFNCIPKVAVVPILIMWFGIGEVPAILTAFLISFFPIVVNVATGLATMEPELEDVLRALGASKLDSMLKGGIPRTQPYGRQARAATRHDRGRPRPTRARERPRHRRRALAARCVRRAAARLLLHGVVEHSGVQVRIAATTPSER